MVSVFPPPLAFLAALMPIPPTPPFFTCPSDFFFSPASEDVRYNPERRGTLQPFFHSWRLRAFVRYAFLPCWLMLTRSDETSHFPPCSRGEDENVRQRDPLFLHISELTPLIFFGHITTEAYPANDAASRLSAGMGVFSLCGAFFCLAGPGGLGSLCPPRVGTRSCSARIRKAFRSRSPFSCGRFSVSV